MRSSRTAGDDRLAGHLQLLGDVFRRDEPPAAERLRELFGEALTDSLGSALAGTAPAPGDELAVANASV